jgi:DNA repair exonuclease SbcCD ATPase subunit
MARGKKQNRNLFPIDATDTTDAAEEAVDEIEEYEEPMSSWVRDKYRTKSKRLERITKRTEAMAKKLDRTKDKFTKKLEGATSELREQAMELQEEINEIVEEFQTQLQEAVADDVEKLNKLGAKKTQLERQLLKLGAGLVDEDIELDPDDFEDVVDEEEFDDED